MNTDTDTITSTIVDVAWQIAAEPWICYDSRESLAVNGVDPTPENCAALMRELWIECMAAVADAAMEAAR